MKERTYRVGSLSAGRSDMIENGEAITLEKLIDLSLEPDCDPDPLTGKEIMRLVDVSVGSSVNVSRYVVVERVS